jgi:SAM-dependent methyltransferase
VAATDPFRDPDLQRRGAGQPAPDVPSIYSFRRPERDWIAWLLDELIPLPIGGTVVDVGCGPGPYVPAARARIGSGLVVPFDISDERLRQVEGPGRVLGDAARLPFTDASCDAALAMHVLYHLPDLDAAVAELRRVLRPGGRLYALTNSDHDMPELLELYVACGGRPAGLGGMAFTAENGAAVLGRSFSQVETVELHNSSLVVTDAAAVVGEVARLRYTVEPSLVAGLPWSTFLRQVEEAVQATIDREGAFGITEHQALFVAA